MVKHDWSPLNIRGLIFVDLGVLTNPLPEMTPITDSSLTTKRMAVSVALSLPQGVKLGEAVLDCLHPDCICQFELQWPPILLFSAERDLLQGGVWKYYTALREAGLKLRAKAIVSIFLRWILKLLGSISSSPARGPVSTTGDQVPKIDPILKEHTPAEIEVGVDQSTVDQIVENADVKCSSEPRNSSNGLGQVEEDSGVPIIMAQDEAHDQNEGVQLPIIVDVKSLSEPREDAEC
ncbi:hypothetical protein L7F22_027698 [Adiantum nelumboides]|nr:hypothetical protein [Adiantum nelumboides]